MRKTYKHVGGAKSAVLPNPMNTRKESKTAPRNKEDEASEAVIVREKFGSCLEYQGHHEQSSAYGDVDCSDFLQIIAKKDRL